MKVEGKGTIAIKTSQGSVKLLHGVQYVPNLAHNLLSVGQLLDGGYSILCNDGFCSVYDKKSGHNLVSIPMAQNRMFPLEVSGVKDHVLVAKMSESNLWHLRYGHLNVKGLKLLGDKSMVVGFRKLMVLTSVKDMYMENRVETHFLSTSLGGLQIVWSWCMLTFVVQ